MLAIEGLTVRYGAVAALSRVDLQVHEGELVGVVGANGAGKTTLLSTIVGLVAPVEGGVSFLGQPITRLATERIARRGIALVPEGRHIFGTLTVRENLLLGTSSRAGKGPNGDLRSIFERFPVLERFEQRSARSLSGGEQQQLAIARALIAQPKLLLLDEPSLGLAPLMVNMIFDLVGQLRNEGTTILLVEQNARRTLQVADRSYVLKLGRVALQGTAADYAAMEPAELEDAYLGVGVKGDPVSRA
jgi:branched-chain amino acid transport system ATP-binding protein